MVVEADTGTPPTLRLAVKVKVTFEAPLARGWALVPIIKLVPSKLTPVVVGETEPMRLVNPGVVVLLKFMVLVVPAVTTSWPPVRSPLGTAIVGAVTAREKVVVADCPPAEAPIVTSFVPTLVGIPESTPPLERERPRRFPEEML
jgi:hypothetical protein